MKVIKLEPEVDLATGKPLKWDVKKDGPPPWNRPFYPPYAPGEVLREMGVPRRTPEDSEWI